MQNQDQVSIVKDYEREPVPDDMRKNWLQMGVVWVASG